MYRPARLEDAAQLFRVGHGGEAAAPKGRSVLTSCWPEASLTTTLLPGSSRQGLARLPMK